MENTSGQGSTALVPQEIDRWNWGAFLLHWIWGIGNNTLIALLMFVPLVNVVMVFILGAKGSTWAWRNKRWQSVEQFKDTQRKWAIWGLVVYSLLIALFVALFFLVVGLLKNTEAYQFGLTKLQANSEAMTILGPPISTGMVQGSIETSGLRERPTFRFP
jgi:ABC-type spermidine/putrescine transport system permease subunit II